MKIKKLRLFYLAIFLIIFSSFGCTSSIKNISYNYTIDPTKSTGVAVISLTELGFLTFAHWPQFSESYLYYSVQGLGAGLKSFSLHVRDDDWKGTATTEDAKKIVSSGSTGRLVVIELKEGIYEINGGRYVHREISPGIDIGRTYAYRCSIRFNVIAGKVVYLGNLHLVNSSQGYDLSIINNWERDSTLLFRKYPQFKQDEVVVNLMKKI